MKHYTLRNVLWSLPQPVAALGGSLLVASAITTQWMSADLLTSILLLSPIAILLLVERLTPKREDWLLSWRELLEDAFWVFATYLIWLPIYEDYYDTPISNAFTSLSDAIAFPFNLHGDTIAGLLSAALIGILASEFIYYWLHRLQHRILFFWRMHATHHHITKMSAGRADRTHPLEFLALNLGGAVTLAFLGASDDVVAIVLVFRMISAHITHCNLPLKSGFFGWLFTTPEWHQLHHSIDPSESNTNYGCVIILWDRLFGTFSGKSELERVGNGTGEALSIYTQLTLPFRSNQTLRSL